MIYLDNAATTKLDLDAFEAMKGYLINDYANASQPYSFAVKARKAIEHARAEIARCINAEPNEIYFTSCGTESDNWAIKGFVKQYNSTSTLQIVSSAFEHHAVLNACKSVESETVKVSLIYPDKNGYIQCEKLESMIEKPVGLVSVMMVNNEIGTVQPIKELCQIAHEKGYCFHTDAVQAVGHLDIDVKDLGIDMLSASAHKFNGPKGIGFLYIKSGTSISPLIDGGSQEKQLRAGTENVAFIIGMATALSKNTLYIDENIKHLSKLENTLLNFLNTSGVEYKRNGGGPTGIISLSFAGINGETLLHRLDLQGFSISTGSACDGQNDQISHVLGSIGLEPVFANGTIRVSMSKHNTQEEILKFGKALVSTVNKLKNGK